jgi:phosphoglycolate phosphatase
MSQLRSPTAVFDLDGTLADTVHDLIATLNVVMDREGLPHLPLEEGREMIGAGARALIERGLEAVGREVTPAHLDELHRFFLAYYNDNLCVHTTLFPGVVEALDRLDAAGFRLAVCTNKYEDLSVALLEGLGIANRFEAICGRDTFAYFKPDPRHLTLTIEKAGGDPARAVMVGDSLADVATAKAAGIPVVAVTFGYSEIPAREFEADRLITHFDELYEAIGSLMKAAA